MDITQITDGATYELAHAVDKPKGLQNRGGAKEWQAGTLFKLERTQHAAANGRPGRAVWSLRMASVYTSGLTLVTTSDEDPATFFYLVNAAEPAESLDALLFGLGDDNVTARDVLCELVHRGDVTLVKVAQAAHELVAQQRRAEEATANTLLERGAAAVLGPAEVDIVRASVESREPGDDDAELPAPATKSALLGSLSIVSNSPAKPARAAAGRRPRVA